MMDNRVIKSKKHTLKIDVDLRNSIVEPESVIIKTPPKLLEEPQKSTA